MIYDSASAETYHVRRDRNAVEQYQHDHWAPILSRTIADLSKNKRTLDVGCGTGEHLGTSERVSSFTAGVDISERMLRFAATQGRYQLVCASAERLPFGDDAFEALYSIGMLEYVDPERAVREMVRVVMPGAKILIQTPNRYGGRKWISHALAVKKGKPVHARYLSRKEMIRLLEQNGLHVDEVIMNDGLVYLPGVVPKALAMAIYRSVAIFFKMFPYNPWSQNMLFSVTKR